MLHYAIPSIHNSCICTSHVLVARGQMGGGAPLTSTLNSSVLPSCKAYTLHIYLVFSHISRSTSRLSARYHGYLAIIICPPRRLAFSPRLTPRPSCIVPCVPPSHRVPAPRSRTAIKRPRRDSIASILQTPTYTQEQHTKRPRTLRVVHPLV